MACGTSAQKILNLFGKQSGFRWFKYSPNLVLKVSSSSASHGSFSQIIPLQNKTLFERSIYPLTVQEKKYFHDQKEVIFFNHSIMFGINLSLSLKEINQLKEEETVEEHEETIYKGILSTQIKLVKSFSLLTSVIGLSCQPSTLAQHF